MSLASMALTGTWLYITSRGLAKNECDASERRAVTRRALTTSGVFVASIQVSFLGLLPAVLLWLGVIPAARVLVARSQRSAEAGSA